MSWKVHLYLGMNCQMLIQGLHTLSFPHLLLDTYLLHLPLMDIVLLVVTPLRASIDTNLMYKNCEIMVRENEHPADLVLLSMSDYDVI